MVDVTRIQHLAPEEIAGAIFLAVAILVAVMSPGPIAHLFESPYSTPAPGGGPARKIIEPTPSPASLIPSYRYISGAVPLPVVDPNR